MRAILILLAAFLTVVVTTVETAEAQCSNTTCVLVFNPERPQGGFECDYAGPGTGTNCIQGNGMCRVTICEGIALVADADGRVLASARICSGSVHLSEPPTRAVAGFALNGSSDPSRDSRARVQASSWKGDSSIHVGAGAG